MQVTRGKATKCFKPKGFSKAEDADAEVADTVSVEAHHSKWGVVSLISPQHTGEDFHMLHRAAGFPKDLEVNKAAQHDHQHSYHQHLLPPMAE
jgi:hypothetical protein